jgi:hypothetical protein
MVGNAMGLNWLRSPLLMDGNVIRGPLDPNSIAYHDLPDICYRMHLILDEIEFKRCEGRLIPSDIFDAMDTLGCDLVHHPDRVSLKIYAGLIARFGTYYGLDGKQPIEISRRAFDSQPALSWFGLDASIVESLQHLRPK